MSQACMVVEITAPEPRSVLDIYACGIQDTIEEQEHQLRWKVRKMRAVRERMVRRILTAERVITDMDPVLKVYERELKRLEAKRRETVEQRRGL